MTTIYLINNGLTINNLNFISYVPLESKREKRILSVEGEEASKNLALDKDLLKVNTIYTSNYVMSMETAKYLAQKLELEINVLEELGERVIGNLGDKKIRVVSELQENDFDYKLPGGESLNEVKRRMLKSLKKIREENEDKTVAVFTHNVAITSLLSEYCERGFNLDNRLILNYEDEAIIDGTWEGIKIIEMKFLDDGTIKIKRKQ